MAKQLTGEQVLEMQSKGLNINEIQTLAAQKGYSMPDNRNFSEKIAPVLDMVFGGGKVGEAIGTKFAEKFSAGGQELAQQEAQGITPKGTMAETFKQPSGGEVAGSALQSAALFTPVGKIAGGITSAVSKTGLKTGVSAIGKIGAGAVAGGAFDVSQNLQEGKTGAEVLKPGLGTVIGAGLPAVGVGLNVAGRVAKTVAPKLLSYTSDVPEEAFTTMLKRREPVVSAIKAGATPQTALKNTQDAVRQLRTTLSNDWQEGVTAIQDEFKGKRLGLSDKSEVSLLKIANEFGFEDKLPQNLKSASVNEWMGTLKAINGLPKMMLAMSPKGAQLRELKKALEGSVIKTFGGDKGSVAQLYKNYSAKKGVFDAANDIVSAYSTGKPIQQSTALNRLQTLFNENKPAYLEAILDLEKATGRDLLSEITASKFANKLPTMGTSVSATSGIMAPTGPLDKVIKLMILPLSSPRSSGFIARTLGKVKSPGMPKGISPGDRVLPTLQKGVSNINKTMAGKGGLSIQDVSKSPLLTEARKYKTAEEFVRAQVNVYHGTTEKIVGDIKYPLYTTPSREYANVFANSTSASSLGKSGTKLSDGKAVHEFAINPKARVFDITNPKDAQMIKDYWSTDSTSGAFYPTSKGQLDWTEGENLAQYIHDNDLPFDALKLDEGGNGIDPSSGMKVIDKGISFLALNKNALLTRSQLTSIWEKAHKK